VYIAGSGEALLGFEDKAHAVAWARELAADHKGTVDVYDAAGRLETNYSS
jgi:hypothetical protein